jgi:hypothetical protein
MTENSRLYCFHGRGIGERARQLLAIGGIEFAGLGYGLDEFAAMHDLKARLPFGQIPAPEVALQLLPWRHHFGFPEPAHGAWAGVTRRAVPHAAWRRDRERADLQDLRLHPARAQPGPGRGVLICIVN